MEKMMKNLLIFYFCIFFYTRIFAGEYNGLIDRSPFGQCKSEKVSRAANQPDETKNFELHGIWSCDGEYVFSIHNKNTNKNLWVSLNDKQLEVSVKNFYPENKTVEIAMPDGNSCLLKLQSEQKIFGKLNNILPVGQVVDDDARERFLSIVNGKEQR